MARLFSIRAMTKIWSCLVGLIIMMHGMSELTFAQSRLGIAVRDSAIKVRPNDVIHADAMPRVELAAARNEYETIQVIIAAGETSLKDIDAQVTPLIGVSGRIPPHDVGIYLVYSHSIEAPSDAYGEAGQWPDALVPLQRPFSVPADHHQSLWIKVFVGPKTAAGTYRGSIVLSSPGTKTSTIEIALEVWDITLPEEHHLSAIFGLDYDSIYKFEGAPSDSVFQEEVLPSYYAALSGNRATPIFIYQAQPDYREVDGKVVVQFEQFHRQMEKAFPRRPWGPVAVPFSESWPVDSTRYPLFSPEYNRRATAYLQQVAAYLDKAGILDRAFLYIPGTDEPHDKSQYGLVRKFAALIRSADPRLRMLQTIHAACEDCQGEGIETLNQDVTLWCPNIAYFDGHAMRLKRRLFGFGGVQITRTPSGWTPAFTDRLKQRGEKIWWYLNPWTFLSEAPQPRYPTLFIDHQGIEHRMIGWLAFKYGISGVGHWNATYWRHVRSPWSEVPRGEEGSWIAGDGSLLYPAHDSDRYTGQPKPTGPISSIRLELLREGMEDYEFLFLLTQAGLGRFATDVANGMVKSLQEYARHPTDLRNARRRLADALTQH